MNKLKFTAQSFILQPRKLIPWIYSRPHWGKRVWASMQVLWISVQKFFPNISAPKWTSFEESYSGTLKAMLCCQIFSVDLQNVVLSKRFTVENLKMANMLNTHVNKNWGRVGRPLGYPMSIAAVIVNSGPYRLLPCTWPFCMVLTRVHLLLTTILRDRYCHYLNF